VAAIVDLLIVALFLWALYALFKYSMRFAGELDERHPGATDGDPQSAGVSPTAHRPAGPPGARPVRGGSRDGETRDAPVEPSPTLPGVPQGKRFDEYVQDGLMQMQVYLAQQARRSGRTPTPPSPERHRPPDAKA